MAAKSGILGWLTEHWFLSLGTVGLGTFFLVKRAHASSAGSPPARDAQADAAVLASATPDQRPAIQSALNAGAPAADIRSALDAGISPTVIAAVAVSAKSGGNDVADRMLAFADAHPNATDAEIQAAGRA